MISSPIKRLGLLAAFVSLGICAFASNDRSQQIKIDKAINSPTLAVKYSGVHASLMELRINGESFGTRTVDDASTSGETTFTINVLSLKDGDNDIEIRLYDKDGHIVGSEKTVITTDSDTKGPVFLSTPKVGENVSGPCEITVGFGRDFKNTYVSFFVDNQFKSMMNFPPFTYVWDTTRETNGWHEVEAWVVDDTSSTYKTRKVRVYVNNPGGHTYRPVAKATTPAKAIVKTNKLPALPDPSKGLTTSPNPISATAKSVEAPIKTIVQATSTIAAAKTTAMAPTIVGLTIDNSVAPKLDGHSAGMKQQDIPESATVGPRLMTPTGKRVTLAKTAPATTTAKVAATPAKTNATHAAKTAIVKLASDFGHVSANPVSAAVDGSSASAKATTQTPEAQSSNPQISPTAPKSEDDTAKLVALVPAAKTEEPASTFHPLTIDASGDGVMSKPTPESSEPAAPVVEPETHPATVTSVSMTSMGSTDSIVKPTKLYPNTPSKIAAKHRGLISVVYGTRLPLSADYTILFNGERVAFDVAPSVKAGVPVTPFRHLIEKSGGQINWLGDEKEVTATTDGRDIWLKIGDRYAKVNSLNVKLELAPFIESGRTIVPLSFISTALNVDVDYDKATGHVLITPKK